MVNALCQFEWVTKCRDNWSEILSVSLRVSVDEMNI